MIIIIIIVIEFLKDIVDYLRARDALFRRLLLGLFLKIKKNYISMQSIETLRFLYNPIQYILARSSL